MKGMREEFIYDRHGNRFVVFIFHNMVGEIPLRHSRAITVAILDEATCRSLKNPQFCGVSACSVLDEYDEQRGIDIAVGRAWKKWVKWNREERLSLPAYRGGIQDIQLDDAEMAPYIGKAYELAHAKNKKLNQRHNAKAEWLIYAPAWAKRLV